MMKIACFDVNGINGAPVGWLEGGASGRDPGGARPQGLSDLDGGGHGP